MSIPIIVDNFAGGGGASLGIELALGRPVDVAINHDRLALAMHAINHRRTIHLCENVFDVNPWKVAAGRPIGLVWFSPDCKHFSKAKGGKPADRKIRALAWVAIRWAWSVHPQVIMLENVEEFEDWGPLNEEGRPITGRKGETFQEFVTTLRDIGYQVEWRVLRACDYGAPTIRKRLFLIARRDRQPIVWPEPTHGPGRDEPYRSAAECIGWMIPGRSIFGRQRPLCDATMRRIARGVWKYVILAKRPFIVPVTHQGGDRVYDIREPLRTITGAHRGEMALVSPTLVQSGYGERPGQAPRVPGLEKPLGTVVAGGSKHALVAAFLARHYGGPNGRQVPGSPMTAPTGTVTSHDHHGLVAATLVRQFGTSTAAPIDAPMGTVMPDGGGKTQLVQAFLTKYYKTATGSSLRKPAPTVTTRDRLGLVTVQGQDYQITDIAMRMLQPRELFRAQGFPDSYVIDLEVDGKALAKTAKIRMVGNSVCPPIAAALVAANCSELAVERGAQMRMFEAGG